MLWNISLLFTWYIVTCLNPQPLSLPSPLPSSHWYPLVCSLYLSVCFCFVIYIGLFYFLGSTRWQGCGAKGILVRSWWDSKLVMLLWKTVWRCLKTSKSTYHVTQQFHCWVYIQSKWKHQFKKIHASQSSALFTLVKTWKCPSADEWIKKMWYVYIQWNIT